jgi:hypothetical protein
VSSEFRVPIGLPPGNDPSIPTAYWGTDNSTAVVQPVASHFTDRPTPANLNNYKGCNKTDGFLDYLTAQFPLREI